MSEMVKITRSKLESLSSAIRTKLGTEATDLTLAEMIVDIPELAKPKTDVQSGTYDANGNMLKSWDQLIADGNLDVSDGRLMTFDDLATSFANVDKLVIDSSVTEIYGFTFGQCANLKTIIIPDSVTSIGDRAFIGCTGLTTITIPDSVTSIGKRIFQGCTNLTTIHYSGTATGAPWGATNATVVP